MEVIDFMPSVLWSVWQYVTMFSLSLRHKLLWCVFIAQQSIGPQWCFECKTSKSKAKQKLDWSDPKGFQKWNNKYRGDESEVKTDFLFISYLFG